MEKEFEKFRNHNPYKVPDGFFENITKQTLEKARQRKQMSKVRKMLVAFSVAASVIVLIAVGSVFFNQTKKTTETALVQPVTEEMIFEEIQPEEIFMTDPAEIMTNETIETEPEENVQENVSENLLDNLIAGLSDEDLQQLEAVIQEELLITEFLKD
jgi:ABC-type lipoprotein release transport system permease subunit